MAADQQLDQQMNNLNIQETLSSNASEFVPAPAPGNMDNNLINSALNMTSVQIEMESSSINVTTYISPTDFNYNNQNHPAAVIYEFYIPQIIVGRLIGRFGSFVSKIKAVTGANILVKRHPTSPAHKICAIEGLPKEIQHALEMIRARFPAPRFPLLSLDQINHGHFGSAAAAPTQTVMSIPSNKILLIEGVSSDVIVSHVSNLNDVFLQHPCHPTYPALAPLHETLTSFYEGATAVPNLLRPFNVGVICVARISSKKWFRAEVVEVDEEKEKAKVKLVDVGGYHKLPIKYLKQIRVDLLKTPFQATQCGLANILPLDKDVGWSKEAIHHFKNLSFNHVLRAFIVDYDVDNDRALIHLFKINGTQPPILINKELADYGLVKWAADDNMDQFTGKTTGTDCNDQV